MSLVDSESRKRESGVGDASKILVYNQIHYTEHSIKYRSITFGS